MWLMKTRLRPTTLKTPKWAPVVHIQFSLVLIFTNLNDMSILHNVFHCNCFGLQSVNEDTIEYKWKRLQCCKL